MMKKLFACLFAASLSANAFANDSALDQAWIQDSLAEGKSTEIEVDGLTYQLVLKATELKHDVFLCITAPCPDGIAVIEAAMIVKNTSSETKTLTFNNSNQFELEVQTLDGQKVLSSSDGMMFLMMMEEMTLAAGEEKVFTQTLKLANLETSEKIIGDYKVVGSLKSSADATLSLDISVME